jgi:hypothetical protein
MMRINLDWHILLLFICSAVAVFGGIDQKTKNALKVKHILRTIERHSPRSGSKDLSAEVSKIELNDYIAYRLTNEKQDLINKLEVDLLANNYVQGKMRFNAQQLNLDILFGKVLDFDFEGTLHSRNGAARLDLAALRLNGQPVKPQVLDMVLRAAALYYGTEFGSVADWHELPKGTKRLVVHKNKAVLYY